jgi:plasmid stabilization system protein ParE
MATLIVSPEARDDVREIAAYLREVAGPLVADKYPAEFDRVTDLLTLYPGIGAPKPKLGPEARTTVVARMCSSTITASPQIP